MPIRFTIVRRVCLAWLLIMAGHAQAGDSIEFPGRYTLTLHPSIKALNCRSGPSKQYPAVEWLSAGVIVDVREVHASPEVWALTQWGCYVRARTRYLSPTDQAPTPVERAMPASAEVSDRPANTVRLWSTGRYTVNTRARQGQLNCRAAPTIDAAVFAVFNNGDQIRIIGVEQPADPWLLTQEKCYVKGNPDYLKPATD